MPRESSGTHAASGKSPCITSVSQARAASFCRHASQKKHRKESNKSTQRCVGPTSHPLHEIAFRPPPTHGLLNACGRCGIEWTWVHMACVRRACSWGLHGAGLLEGSLYPCCMHKPFVQASLLHAIEMPHSSADPGAVLSRGQPCAGLSGCLPGGGEGGGRGHQHEQQRGRARWPAAQVSLKALPACTRTGMEQRLPFHIIPTCSSHHGMSHGAPCRELEMPSEARTGDFEALVAWFATACGATNVQHPAGDTQ